MPNVTRIGESGYRSRS